MHAQSRRLLSVTHGSDCCLRLIFEKGKVDKFAHLKIELEVMLNERSVLVTFLQKPIVKQCRNAGFCKDLPRTCVNGRSFLSSC